MDRYVILREDLQAFERELYMEERSPATIQKYMRNINVFFAEMQEITKENILLRKRKLLEEKTVKTVNGILVAVNRFFRFKGLYDLQVHYCKRQREIFSDQEKELSREEYLRLVKTAEKQGDQRLSLVLQTICSTGIRVSELQFITAEAVKKGRAEVKCKGKNRVIFLPNKLQRKLQKYMKRKGIKGGPVFVTKNGKALDRSNIWSDMKGLCEEAGVEKKKVFPHNLRHLFARIFYNMEKDIAKLADLLGHSSIETTRIYIMESGETHRKKIEQMHLLL